MVSEKLKESLANKWPDNYFTLFGSINDESFCVEKIEGFSIDIERENL